MTTLGCGGRYVTASTSCRHRSRSDWVLNCATICFTQYRSPLSLLLTNHASLAPPRPMATQKEKWSWKRNEASSAPDAPRPRLMDDVRARPACANSFVSAKDPMRRRRRADDDFPGAAGDASASSPPRGTETVKPARENLHVRNHRARRQRRTRRRRSGRGKVLVEMFVEILVGRRGRAGPAAICDEAAPDRRRVRPRVRRTK